MDNLHVDVTSRGFEAFKAALSLFDRSTAAAFKVIDQNKRLLLYWSDHPDGLKGASKLPYNMNFEAYVRFAWGWLEQVDYGPQPDHDGSNVKGFRVYNDAWAQIKDEGWGAFVAIEPEWAMYGK